jgi:hypothetical protein
MRFRDQIAETVQRAEQCRGPAVGRAKNRQDLIGGDLQAEIPDHLFFSVVEF